MGNAFIIRMISDQLGTGFPFMNKEEDRGGLNCSNELIHVHRYVRLHRCIQEKVSAAYLESLTNEGGGCMWMNLFRASRLVRHNLLLS